MISIHALREEGDLFFQFNLKTVLQFLSTPSARRATGTFAVIDVPSKFLSTPSARRATTSFQWCLSIPKFLSTPSARRATLRRHQGWQGYEHFYPRPPRGGRRRAAGAGYTGIKISIHALREEGDRALGGQLTQPVVFLSTPSARRATAPPMSLHSVLTFLSTPSARRAT